MQSNSISKTYRGGLYLRLSKEDEDVAEAKTETVQSNSIENQKEYIQDFLKRKPEIEIIDSYKDGSDKIGLNQQSSYSKGGALI